jgi:biopolymer transport protein ExbB
MSLLELLLKGGWIMVPILFLSIVTVYAILERTMALSKTMGISQNWLHILQEQIVTGDIQGAELLCDKKHTPIARVLKAGIKKLDQPAETIEVAMQVAGQAEIYHLEKNLPLLGTIASTAPMLGFLGTVLGMIQAFMAMAQSTATAITPQLLSSGIYEAMITTAAGLVVGIFADLGYKYLLTKVQKVSYRIELTANQFLLFIQSNLKKTI